MILLAVLIAASSVESPERDTLFDLDPPMAAATGATIGGGGALVVAIVGAAMTTFSPAFALLPIVATVGMPVAAALGAVFAANLSDSALNVGLGTAGGVIVGGLVGGAVGLVGGSLINDDVALLGAWSGAMIVGTAGGAVAAGLLTE